jgi:hypothetical protein
MSFAGFLALAVIVFAVWLVKGLAQAMRDRIAERVVAWAIPDGQALTYRLAVAIGRLAEVVKPRRRRVTFRYWASQESDLPFGDESTGEWRYEAHESPAVEEAGGFALGLCRRLKRKVLPWLHARQLDYSARFVLLGAHAEEEWSRPSELLAELEADLREEQPVGGPLRMSMPVLVQAFRLRGHVAVEALLFPILLAVALLRSTRAVALVEARVYGHRYPRAGVRTMIRTSATWRVLEGSASVAEAAERAGVPRSAVRRWVAMAHRDARRFHGDIPLERREVARLADPELSARRAR